jgi:hypothetical protein
MTHLRWVISSLRDVVQYFKSVIRLYEECHLGQNNDRCRKAYLFLRCIPFVLTSTSCEARCLFPGSSHRLCSLSLINRLLVFTQIHFPGKIPQEVPRIGLSVVVSLLPSFKAHVLDSANLGCSFVYTAVDAMHHEIISVVARFRNPWVFVYTGVDAMHHVLSVGGCFLTVKFPIMTKLMKF